MLEKLFKLKENNTNVKTEVTAGLTTFFTMVYIVAVQPGMLATTGMNYNGVFVASILAAVVGTLIMALYANVPYAQACGMGLNAFFAFTVVQALGYTWQQALGMVFICGIFNMIITFTSIRKVLIKAIPESLQNAIGGGIGLFIAYMGLKNGGLLSFSADPGTYTDIGGGTLALDSTIVPGLNLSTTSALLCLLGLIIMVVLYALNVKGAIIIGIIATTLIGIPLGITQIPEKLFSFTAVGDIKYTFGAVFSSEGLPSFFAEPERIISILLIAFSFTLTDTFDTIGTFIGTGVSSGIFTKKEMEDFENSSSNFSTRLDKALVADSVASSVASIMGTSNVTTFVESAAGIGAGGRTGLTAFVVAILFLLCLPLAPLFQMIPMVATAPALILVGVLMAGSLKEVEWGDFEEAMPAFITVALMTLSYSITNGIAAGFVFYCIVKIAKGKFKEIHPVLLVATILFALNFAMTALGYV